jgi:hypothetical protein
MEIIKKLASVQLTVVILSVLIVVCIAGTLAKPEESSRQVYSSFWFWGILIAFALNLLACTISSLRKSNLSFILVHLSILAILFGGVIGKGWGSKGRAFIYEQEKISVYFEDSQLESIFRLYDHNRDGFWDNTEIRTWHQKNFPQLPDLHFLQFDFDEDQKLKFDEWFQAILQSPLQVQLQVGTPLTFEVALQHFAIEHYHPRYYLIVLVNDTRIEEYLTVKSGASYWIPLTSYRLQIAPYECQDETKPFSIHVSMTDGNQKETHTLQLHPTSGVTQDQAIFIGKVRVIFAVEGGDQRTVKAWKSALEIWEQGRVVKQGLVLVNHPLEYKGFQFFQSTYFFDSKRKKACTGLMVVKDPGIVVVYFGFLLLTISLLGKYFLSPLIFKRKNSFIKLVHYVLTVRLFFATSERRERLVSCGQ